MKDTTDQWDQKAITEWSRNTFGVTSPTVVAARMNKEVAELLTALTLANLSEARKECADVGVMLLQVAELLGIDLMQAVSDKMDVNYKRQWEQTPAGDFQHKGGT